jgi:hypothetical protein
LLSSATKCFSEVVEDGLKSTEAVKNLVAMGETAAWSVTYVSEMINHPSQDVVWMEVRNR